MQTALANSNQPTQVAISRLVDRINAEPAYRGVLFKLLQFCKDIQSTGEIAAKLYSFPEMQTAIHSPEILLSWMIEAGGIEQISSEEREEKWRTTEIGEEVLDQYTPMKQWSELFSQEPQYRDHWLRVLTYCETARSTAEVESWLSTHHDSNSSALPVMYLIQTLEKVGGLEWIGKWRTTDSGRQILGQMGNNE